MYPRLGDRVRIDIPDELDPDFEWHGEHGLVIGIHEDVSGRFYTVGLERYCIVIDAHLRDLRPPLYAATQPSTCLIPSSRRKDMDEDLFHLAKNKATMPEFFIPHAEDADEAEEVFEATAKFVEKQRGEVKREPRIYSVKYYDGDTDQTYEVSVGGNVPKVGEPAISIYESASDSFDVYYICTLNRAVAQGVPVMIGKNNVKRVEYFDEESY
ncbi:hypothetical protein [Natrialba swarupiae]|uniref:DUF8139 domain-containing protein n=1 Tax=Natrialba swarupiae TaxID=2448032 RepID=A0A5D5AP14_9EURY|nr:hypothetical protein [Natrialba swarupiae]TYT60861.1 hypothetical protein FYC77_16675 [Natrialba swarupiae]